MEKTLETYTDKELFQDEAILVRDNPLSLVEHDFLMIKTKEGDLVKLRLNPVQKVVFAVFLSLYGKSPVRLLVLKARQPGISTLIQAIIYALTSLRKGINSLVIADDIKGSNYLFEMQKLFYETLDNPFLKPKIKHSNEKKLEFSGIHSQVLIDTAENPNAGRKFTLQYVHLSEAAFFPKLDTIMLGLLQSVPNSPNTMIVLESTANGVGNDFYNRWCDAVEGNSDWKAIFIPWFELPSYSMPLVNGLYPIEGLKGDKAKFIKGEKILKEKYKLSAEQMNWRRWCIINNCGGKPNLFCQEYPTTWQEAFIMSGNLYFDGDALLLEEEKSTRAKEKQFPRIGDIVRLDNRYIFRECEEGKFRIYEFPQKETQYAIGGDSAEGLPHGDDSAMIVLNKKTNNVVCAYNCQADSDDFSLDLIKAGHFYNMAMIAVENKGYGTSVCKKIYAHYGNIFRKIRDKTGQIDVTDELGWNTNSVTRPQMLGQLREEILDNATDLLDKELLSQCRTFINNPKKKRPEAEVGKKDDMVFARAIAGMVRHYYPNIIRRPMNNSLAGSIAPNQGYGFRK